MGLQKKIRVDTSIKKKNAKLNIKYAILVISLGALAIMIVVLDYMKKRFGLKPKQYAKEDIRFN